MKKNIAQPVFIIVFLYATACFAATPDSLNTVGAHKLEFLPIFSYDTDAGFGYGLKSFFLNYLQWDESIDVVVFNSSKGERWYKIVFSVPDFELRQGKVYPVALDLTVDYDKWIDYNFFGVGNTSSYAGRESYSREPMEITLALSRGFSGSLVGQMGLKYMMVRDFDFQPDSRLENLPPALNVGRISYISLQAVLHYDSRNSFINPSRGVVFQGEVERAPACGATNVGFTRFGLWLQSYCPVFTQNTVFAARGGLQDLEGDDLPVQVLLPIGGGSTLRGSTQDRYLDKVSALVNVELRFPIIWRFGGILGYDAGKVWGSPGQIDCTRWASNPAAGLRFYFDTFIVRLDVGFGKESTGFYLNFGQLF
jgi:outer membrane protein assembly factor BamA